MLGNAELNFHRKLLSSDLRGALSCQNQPSLNSMLLIIKKKEQIKSNAATDKESAALAVRTALNLIPIFAKISFPIIPETSLKLLSIFEMNETSIKWPKDGNNLNLNELAHGSKLYNPGPLFDKIDEETLNNWKTSFPGGEN